MAGNNSQLIPAGAADNATNTAATPPRYVIIGNGFSATVNHATLRLSDYGKMRLGRAEVWHIFEAEPWATYIDHDMGQWTDLLTLPGYRNQPRGRTNRFLRSSEFGQNNRIDFSYNANPAFLRVGTVEKIEKVKISGKNKYSIKLKKDKRPIIADFVDVCPGPGPARLLKQTKDKKVAYAWNQWLILIPDAVLKEYNDPNPTGRVLSAHAYMSAACKRRKGTVCVFGSGPLAAGCVEVALASGCKAVYWVSKDVMNISFSPGRRYDELARLENKQRLPWVPGPPPTETLLFPSRDNLKFGEGYKLAEIKISNKKSASGDPGAADDASSDNPDDAGDDSAVEDQASKDKLLEIRFAKGVPRGRTIARFVDPARPTQKEMGPLIVDQLIISASNINRLDEPGSPAQLVQDVRASEPEGKFSLITAPLTRVKVPGIGQVTFGVQTKDGTFRLLGTAGLTHEDRTSEESAARRTVSRLKLYEKSLPDQAHVGLVGVSISAAAVAHANGFFQNKPNDCVNLAHAGELLTVWGVEVGNALFDARRQRIDPFTVEKTSPDDAKYPLPKTPSNFRYGQPEEYWPIRALQVK